MQGIIDFLIRSQRKIAWILAPVIIVVSCVSFGSNVCKRLEYECGEKYGREVS